MSRVVKRKVTWRVIVVNRPGLDMLDFEEAPLKRTFPTRKGAGPTGHQQAAQPSTPRRDEVP